MRRRSLLVGTLALAVLTIPLTAAAQQATRAHRIGWLSVASRAAAVDSRAAFTEALRQLGYDEGRTLFVEHRFAEGSSDRLRSFAAELVGLKVDIVVTEGTPAALAAKRATSSIPIVIMGPADPVGVGLVSSLARPGGNVTGVSAAYREIAAKCVELLSELVPGMSRIAFLGNRANVVNQLSFASAQAAADSLGLVIEYLSATTPAEIGPALDTLGGARVQGIIVSGDGVIWSRSREVVDFMARARLPAVYFVDAHVAIGGLMSYGPSARELYRQAAIYVDKILKGARPADLPVEQPTKFELVINMKTARALDLTIPSSLLLRADHVIE